MRKTTAKPVRKKRSRAKDDGDGMAPAASKQKPVAVRTKMKGGRNKKAPSSNTGQKAITPTKTAPAKTAIATAAAKSRTADKEPLKTRRSGLLVTEALNSVTRSHGMAQLSPADKLKVVAGRISLHLKVTSANRARLDELAKAHDKTIQDLGLEAFELLFQHYGVAAAN